MTLRAHRIRACLVVLVCVASLLVTTRSSAAGADSAVHDAVQQIMSEDYPGSLGPAKKKLQDQLAACLKQGCSASVKAEVYVALGMVASQLGQEADAKTNFKNALGADPGAKFPSGISPTPTMKAQFDEVAGSGGGGGGGGEEEQPQTGSAALLKLIGEALAADRDGRLEECIEKDKAALKIDEQPRTRLHLASCESRSGKLVDALKDAQQALKVGIDKRDKGVMTVARTRVKELLDRIPHVTFVPPPNVSDLEVTFDERPVPTDALTKKFSVDPGKHKVVAKGSVNGGPGKFEEEYDVKEREFTTIRITLKPAASGFLTEGQIQCMVEAKTQEDVDKCRGTNAKNLVVRIAADLSGYSDTNSVAVYTPGINASIVSPTSGWNAGGNFLIDAVSAASPDIVSSASPPFKEFRYNGGVNGGYKPGVVGVNANGNISSSPDYVSYTLGATATAELNDKLITPTLGYTFSLDRVGRGPNNYLHDFNPLKGQLFTHDIEGGVTFIMTPTSLLVIGGTVTLERGDQSQPYRYIPFFDPDNVAPFVPKGATIDLVNRTRLPIKPLEQLPTSRDRYAAGLRYNKRVGGTATFRIEERLYVDTWGIKASSTDSRFMVDLSRHLRVWPHARLHAQTGANFYQLAYSAVIDQNGGITLPTYRTTDRESSPLITGTGGGGARIELGEPEGDVKYGITVVGDVMYTRYLDSLYVTTRTAVYGSVGFDVEF